uniref:MYND-type domain-containing protein n=1 Tax=Timema bartmani TaxID=61472 RepID=A0A7R9I322_9NEOP|nr:unnamed protein product [Timema bartmani]
MARHNSRRNFPPEYAEEFWIEDEFDDEYYDVGQQGDVWSPIEDNFKLYVGNVPMEMPQAKIEILFRRFGDPIEIYRCPNKPLSNMTWCLITYASYIGIGRGARFQGYGYGYPYGPQRNRRGDLSLEDDLELYDDHTPTMLKLVMTPEGRRISIEPRDRRVTVIPSDQPISDFFHTPTKNNLEATSSENGLLEPGIAMALPEGDGSVLGGPCNYCKKITTFACANCDFPYCSATCQVEHWPDHKNLCFRLGKNLKKMVKPRDMGGGDGGFIEHQAEGTINHQKFNTRGDDQHLDGSTPCSTDVYQARRTFNEETNLGNRKQYRNRNYERNGNFNNDNCDHKEGGFKSDFHGPRQNFDPNDQSECKIDDKSGRYRNNGFNHDRPKQDFNRNDKEGNRNSHSNDIVKRKSEQFVKDSQSGQNFNKDNQSENRPRGNFTQNRDGNSGGHRKDNFELRGEHVSRDGRSGQNFNRGNQSENRARHNFNPDKEGRDQNRRDNFAHSGEQFSKDGFLGRNFNRDNQGENRTHQRRYNQDREGGGDERLGRGSFNGSKRKPFNEHNNRPNGGNDQDISPFEKNVTGQNKVEEEIWTEVSDAAVGQLSVNDTQPTDVITHSSEERKQRHEFPTTFTDTASSGQESRDLMKLSLTENSCP